MCTKPIFNILAILSLFISMQSCDLLNPDNENDISEKVIFLSKGNTYYFYWSVLDSIYFTEAYWEKTIEKDTIINDLKYYVLNDGSILRATEDKVYSFIEDKEEILFDFSVDVGDTIKYQDYVLIIDSICEEGIFDSTNIETVIHASNDELNSDIIVSISYSTRFGFLGYGKSSNNKSEGYTLIGAIIDGHQHGRIY